jgi:D-arabinose 1-dehydrogenase-like Zn-dependent alcohol dehydrogenase
MQMCKQQTASGQRVVEAGRQHTSGLSARPMVRAERKKERASKYTSSHFSRGFAIQVEQIPDAALLEPTDAVVQITHACMCGTDLWPYRGQTLPTRLANLP